MKTHKLLVISLVLFFSCSDNNAEPKDAGKEDVDVIVREADSIDKLKVDTVKTRDSITARKKRSDLRIRKKEKKSA